MRFVITVSEHRNLGTIFSAYLINEGQQTGQYGLYDKLTTEKLTQYTSILNPEEIQLVKHIDNYSEHNLHKLFCKKKTTSHNFLNTMDSDLFEAHIKPYIEKQIASCIKILQYNPAPIYYKLMAKSIYEANRINLVDAEYESVFNFYRNENGILYRLTIEYKNEVLSLTGKKGVILANTPACLLLGSNLFVFPDIDGKKLIPFFNKEFVSIPKQSEKKYFESFIKPSVAKYKVKAMGFTITHSKLSPKAIVSLEKNLEGHLSLVLRFIYNDNSIFYANRNSGKKVSLDYSEEKVTLTCLERDYNEEISKISKLLSFGLVNKEGPYFSVLSRKSESQENYGPISWLNFNKELLTKNGFEVSQKNLDTDYYLGNFELNIEVSEQENDWFDIKGSVNFDGFEVPFVEFTGHISAGIREFVLPDNRVMILPEEWFESYADLINFSKIDGTDLKLSKQHFSLIDNRIGKIPDNFRDKLKSLLSTSSDKNEAIPDGIKASLRNYQLEGYSWMYRLYENGFGGCLADDMGLGKTLQTLTLLKRATEHASALEDEPSEDTSNAPAQLDLFGSPKPPTKSSRCSLIVVPTSLIHNWINEIIKFVPSLKVNAYTGSTRGNFDSLARRSDIIITSYGLIRNDLNKLTKHQFLYLVLDESQTIKNPASKTYASIIQINADNRLILSGTPIENALSDLWAQFNFINPGLLGSLSFFQTAFQNPIEKHGDESKKERLQQLIAPFILRRTKQEVAKDLPELSEQLIFCSMNEVQENYYEREKSKARNAILQSISEKGMNKASIQILQSLLRLRQISNHPALIDDDYIAGSGKFDEIKRILLNLNNEKHKGLIFSSFLGHLDLVAQWLKETGIKYTILTGETKNREQVVKEFQEQDDCQFFLISLKAGGVGLNLTAASYVLMLDPWWNPAAEKQAINRAHRIGQKKNVMVYRFIAQHTLEEKIVKLQEKKSDLADIFVNENSFKNFSEDEIMDLFA